MNSPEFDVVNVKEWGEYGVSGDFDAVCSCEIHQEKHLHVE
jgi:hypothetical protein